MEYKAGYKIIDMATWPRREHYEYYRTSVRAGYSITARIDVTELYDFAKRNQKKFYGCFIYAAAKAVNQLDAMKMMVTEEGKVGIWDFVVPSFTIFHEDNKTFSDIWTEYSDDFDAFYNRYEEVLSEYGNNKGIKARSLTSGNFFCISCAPWVDYESYAAVSQDGYALFPIITFGKFTETDSQKTLPLTLTISHAACDGYHAGEFFRLLQDEVNNFKMR